MELIFAFRDSSGRWHGDPGIRTCQVVPREGILTYAPEPGSPANNSEFAGQRLFVRFAEIDTPASHAAYELDDGTRLCATRSISELLGDPGAPRAGSSRSTGATAGDPVRKELASNGVTYELSGEPTDDDRLRVEVVGRSAEGKVVGHLKGELPATDMALLAQVLHRTTAELRESGGAGQGSARAADGARRRTPC